jgi:formylglycine-generating enzyme required for sulfatase activity
MPLIAICRRISAGTVTTVKTNTPCSQQSRVGQVAAYWLNAFRYHNWVNEWYKPSPMEDLDWGQTLRGLTAGTRLFDRYTLEKILGRGGMGIVWLASDGKLDRSVALKFLPELMVLDEQAVADLKRETKKSQELRHHHIVSVYDFVSDEQSACIAMEYVDGPTLSALKARKDANYLEVKELEPWVAQLCEALSYAHDKAKVVHRDLKPANLMVNSKGELKVADFGIARSVSDSMSMLTQARGTSGTLAYMSPQQLDGDKASPLDDIYSLGATLYELTTGKPPFYGGDITGQIKNKIAPLLSPRRRELEVGGAPIPAEWESTVAACLAKDPSERPQSVDEVADRLGLEQRPRTKTRATPQRTATGGVVATKQNGVTRKSFIPLLATMVALVVIVGIAAGWYWRSPGRAETVKQEPAATAIPTTAAAPVEAPNPRGAAIIQTEPAGAIVTLGEESRKSPATFNKLKVGPRTVKVERDGYEAVEREISVEENAVTEVPLIKLVRSTGQARIETKPTGMKFDLVDADAEHHTGTTPADISGVPIGAGRIIFKPDSGPEHWQEVKIARNQTVTANWQMETPPSPPVVTLESPKATAAPIPSNTPFPESTFTNSLGRTMVWITSLKIWVSETETTQAEFASLMGHNPSQNFGSDDLPVDSVTLTEAAEFCVRLTNRESARLPSGYAYTLPTDSQWTTFCADASLRDSVTGQTKGRSGPARVKSLRANELGLYDTRGNVWEWTRTPYSASLNSSAARAELSGLDPHGYVLRGGSWRSTGIKLETTTRGSNRSSMRDSTNGFRIVLTSGQ